MDVRVGLWRKLSTEELMLLNCGVGEDSRVPWTARRYNQSILEEIRPEYSLEGLMLKLKLQYCWSPAPAARVSTWREGWCRWVMMQPLNFLGLCIYFKFKIFFYTFKKALGQRFDIFSSSSPRFIISVNHCCSSNRVPASAILSESALPSIIYFLLRAL